MDYLEQICTTFLKDFAASVKPNDQLPVNMAGYNVLPEELQGEVITWCHQYLGEKNCPLPLLSPIIEIVKCKVEKMCKTDASSFGYDEKLGYFNPLRLMQRVISELNEVCLELQDNEKLLQLLNTMPATTAYPKFAVTAVKNTRKKMEDRHIVINDFNRLYSLDDKQPMSFYGIFDGHGGTVAACYCVANFHNFLSQNLKLSRRTDEALRETFLKTDKHYVEKSVQQCFTCGSCALCAVYKIKEKKLFVGWLGDSQALLVKKGRLWQIVQKHSPAYESERNRIESLGGVVLNYGGIWRVQGQLAVARAIGPATYKPFVSNEPDICCIELDGEEDFLVMACDGLWDNLSEDEIAIAVYRQVKEDPENLELVTQKLVEIAKAAGSTDNITVIVIFLKNPADIVDLTDCIQELKNANNIDTEADTVDTTPSIIPNNVASATNPFASLENRILGELQLRNPEMMFGEISDHELSTEKKDMEKDEASGFSADANLVTGDSGCEDSEDEWDFIKIDKESENTNQKKLQASVNSQSSKMSSEILNNPFSDSMKEAEIMSDMQSQPISGETFNEKELVYNVDETEKNDEDFNENSAESKLNPGAAEFVPRSPTSPVQNPLQNPLLMFGDEVVAQSPKPNGNNKEAGLSQFAENISVPTELEFDQEISHRPHETEDLNDFIATTEENLNPKEAAQSDEKLEEDYIAMSNGNGMNGGEQAANLLSFDRFNAPEAMNESFYEEKTCEELNKIQELPQDQFEDNNKGDCLIEESGDIMSFDNINDMMADQSHEMTPQVAETKEEPQEMMNFEQVEKHEHEETVEMAQVPQENPFEQVEEQQQQTNPFEQFEEKMQNQETVEQIVTEIELCQQQEPQAQEPEVVHVDSEPVFEQEPPKEPETELLGPDPELVAAGIIQVCEPCPDQCDLLNENANEVVEECDEKMSNLSLGAAAAVAVTVAAVETAQSANEMETMKNEMNLEPVKEPEVEQNLLIDTKVVEETPVEAPVAPVVEEKCEVVTETPVEKAPEAVLMEAIPDVIPKAAEKTAKTPTEQKAKPKVAATKTPPARKPLSASAKTAASPTTNGVKSVASKTTAAKTTTAKPATSTMASRAAAAPKTAPATRTSVTSRTSTATAAGRTVSSTVTRTTTTTSSTASRARPATSTTTRTTVTKTEVTKPAARKPLTTSTSTTSKTGEARVPISMRSAPKTTTTVDGKAPASRVSSAKPKVPTTSTTTTATRRPVSAPKTSVDAKVSSTRTSVASKSSVPNKKPTTTTATKKIDPKAVPSKNIIKKPATAAPTNDEAPKLAETNGVDAATNN
ncbi:uncharacterized protein LOC134830776 [Culicoides brevitarsis]|uniref:uncharacterized protein LOC134830776 n=1 Tax=Culicoides brevitarsis TaxID=469753 RepID=UPI00307B3DE7